MARHSIPKGDVVLCNLPPYGSQPWLSMGVVLHSALLAQAGIRARVVRPIDPPFRVPPAVGHAQLMTFTFDPPIAERMAAMAAAPREFFDGLVDELLSGGESVVALSIFRNNVDVTLWVAKRIKERRPDVFVIIGGPEAIEEPPAVLLPWVDAVLGADSEASLVPVVRAVLDGKSPPPLPNVWRRDVPLGSPLPAPPLPVIDYRPILRLLVGDSEATVPMLLNWACPYHCAFCSNRGIYTRFETGSVSRVLEEMDSVFSEWRALHEGAPPPVDLQLSDGTTNALPAQFDELLQGVVERIPRWGVRPRLRGQTLFDTRVTAERLQLWAQAGFSNTFFGLDGATDLLRRRLQKPGTVAQVVEAMDLYAKSGQGGLTFGIPVGLPGETDEDFAAAERFVDRALEGAKSLLSITVLPYIFFRSAQDPALVSMNRGERRGVLWRADVPGGDPAVRARRFMRLFERIDGRVPTLSPIPPYLALPAMLPDEDPARLDAWMERYGRVFERILPLLERTARDVWEQAEQAFTRVAPYAGWIREDLVRCARDGAPPALVALFRRPEGGPRVALTLERRDAERPAFAQTRDFNITYRHDWRGVRCDFDEGLIRHCVRELDRS